MTPFKNPSVQSIIEIRLSKQERDQVSQGLSSFSLMILNSLSKL